MSGDIAAIIVATIGTGVALGLLIVPGLRAMRRDIAGLGEGMARVEGAVEALRDTIAGRREGAARRPS